MSKRLRDFIEIFLFGTVVFTALLLSVQIFMNLISYASTGQPVSLEFNLRFFFSFEFLIVTSSSIIGLIYIYWFKKYKDDDKQRNRRR
jgi:hypothetical protein